MATNTQEALLKELGGTAQMRNMDPPPKQGVDSVKALEVPEAPDVPITQRLDKQYATQSGGKGFRVTVRGNYYAQSPENPRAKVLKPYEVSVNLPKLDAALSVIKNHLIEPAVLRKHPDKASVQTHEIVDVQPLSPATPQTKNLQYMNRDQLVAYIEKFNVPINTQDPQYEDVVILREAAMDYHLKPEGFADREAARAAERKEKADILALNPDLVAPKAPKKTKKAPKAKTKKAEPQL